VRSAVTRRASRTATFEPAVRRQEASKCGHACCEQSRPVAWTSRRSALASGRGTLASTCGAKPGKTARAAATQAASAIAERVLIITVPCHQALVAPLSGLLIQTGRFRSFSPRSAKGLKWFHPAIILFRRPIRDETKPVLPRRRAGPPSGSMTDQKYRFCGEGTDWSCRFEAPAPH
jgi:hypothetical protein